MTDVTKRWDDGDWVRWLNYGLVRGTTTNSRMAEMDLGVAQEQTRDSDEGAVPTAIARLQVRVGDFYPVRLTTSHFRFRLTAQRRERWHLLCSTES